MVRASSLPAPSTPLVGRAAQVAELRELFGSGRTRLITLTGPPGVGKTRLGLAVAAEVVSEFPDGVYFVSLARVADPGLVLPAIARTLGLDESGAGGLDVRLSAYLRERDLLLVLDNFEQVRDAAAAVAEMLAAAPRLTVLVASRVALRISGEQEYPVPPLAIPDPRRLPRLPDLAQNPSVALFTARVRAVRPDFELDESNAAVIAEICARLDGLPLALELAAARTRLLTPQALLSRLFHRLAVLTGGARDLPARQRSLEAALEASYELLGPAERQLFRRLGVLAGSYGLDVVEAICDPDGEWGADGLVEALERLLDQSLVRSAGGGGGEVRLSMLDTIREFALERLEAEDTVAGRADALKRRHARVYLQIAEVAEPHLRGPQSRAWLQRLDAEQENFQVALAWSIEQGDADTGLRLAAALAEFWLLRGHITEGRKWLSAVLALPAPDGPPRARALCGAGALAPLHGELRYGRELLEQSLDTWRGLADPHGVATALTHLGMLERRGGAYDTARRHLDEALGLWRRLHEPTGLVQCLAARAGLANAEGDHVTARSLREESLALCRAAGDHEGIGRALIGLGEVARCEGEHRQARAYYAECLELFRKQGSRYHVGAALCNLGYALRRMGALNEAHASFREALGEFQALGHQVGMAVGIAGMAGVWLDRGRTRLAASLLSAGTRLVEEVGARPARADRIDWDSVASSARRALGAAAFEAAWNQGLGMDLTEALAAAVADAPADQSGPAATGDPGTRPDGAATDRDHAGSAPDGAAGPASVSERPAGLTARESDVLELLARGLTYARIGERLFISPRTVDAHLRSVYAKLNVSSRHEAVREAERRGLI